MAFSSYWFNQNDTIIFTVDGKRREDLKQQFSIPAEAYKDPNDKALLKDLFKEINLLEIALLKKPSKAEKKKLIEMTEEELGDFEKFNQEAKDLIETQKRLVKDNEAAWMLYVKSINLAASFVGQDQQGEKIDKKLTPTTTEEIQLLKESIAFTTNVISRTEPFTDIEIKQTNELAAKVKNHLDKNLALILDSTKDIAEIEKKNRWLNFAIAFGAILLIAAVIGMIAGITAGAGLIPIGVVLGVYFATGIAGIGTIGLSVFKKSDLDEKKQSLTQPPKSKTAIHRFHQSAEQYAQDKNVMPKSDPDNKPKK